jgi:hypothetical protein
MGEVNTLTTETSDSCYARETPDGGGRMGSFMPRFPRLGHQPDIVLEGFDGRDSYTILEVKTCEPAGDAYIARQHTDTSRGAAHRYLEQTLALGQYTIPAHQPGAPRLRLLTFAVSVCGALGSEAQTFTRQLSARVAGAVPYRLLDEVSWATQGCAPLLRSAITFSARRALAAGIRRSTCSGAEAAYVERCDDQPAPDPATRRAASFDCPADPAPALDLHLNLQISQKRPAESRARSLRWSRYRGGAIPRPYALTGPRKHVIVSKSSETTVLWCGKYVCSHLD